jgi:hypothetical protein
MSSSLSWIKVPLGQQSSSTSDAFRLSFTFDRGQAVPLFELDLAIQDQVQVGLSEGDCGLDRQLLIAAQGAYWHIPVERITAGKVSY